MTEKYSSSVIESALELVLAGFRADGAGDFALASALGKLSGRTFARAVPNLDNALTVAAEAARIGVRQVRLG